MPRSPKPARGKRKHGSKKSRKKNNTSPVVVVSFRLPVCLYRTNDPDADSPSRAHSGREFGDVSTAWVSEVQ